MTVDGHREERTMSRFSLYRRGKVWYYKLYNPATKRYLGGKAGTIELQ
jgi:hypothetical protein